MFNNKKVCCIIPARQNSKGIKNKNLKKIKNKPLIYYPIKNALSSKIIDKIYINSDSSKIINYSKKFKSISQFLRPKKLGRDKTNIFDVLKDQIEKLELIKKYHILILLEATSPFSTTEDIDKALKNMIKGNYNSFLPVTKKTIPRFDYEIKINKNLIKPNNKINRNRQEFKEKYYLCGIFYISKIKNYLKNKSFIQNKTGFLEINNEKIIEIDDNFDLKLARLLK